MIEQVRILIRGGDGGHGCESLFHRTDKKVITNGGDGGNGGNIVFRADPQAPPLADLKYKRSLSAEAGGHGGSNKKRGRNGNDLVVLVPPGTTLFDAGSQLLIRECMQAGDEVIAAQGGRGGSGNFGGKKMTQGEKGVEIDLEIKSRLPVDAYLIGLPNSGKSALLKALTGVEVKSESYPFATKQPQLGVCKFSDYEQILLCDLPSLYQASHEGRGAGNDFLRHLETAKFLLFVLSPETEFSESLEEGFEALRKELEVYEKNYLQIPYGIIINKTDLFQDKKMKKKRPFMKGKAVFYVSAKTGEGVDTLKAFLKEQLLV